MLYRALSIKMYIWEKLWDNWASVVFSDCRVHGTIRLGMLLDSRKGDRGQLGLACSWIPRMEIDPQLLVAPVCLVRLVLTAFTTDSPCLGEGGRVSLGRETRVSHLVSVWNLGGNVEVLVRAKYNPYTLWEPFTIFFGL